MKTSDKGRAFIGVDEKSRPIERVFADPVKRASLERRLWPKIDRREPGECWPWIAKAKHPFGYGRMTAGRGYHIKAHQAVFALSKGLPGRGQIVRHTCDNPCCCNPSHLIAGTKKDNTHDAMERGRLKNPPIHIGDSHPNAKLDDESIGLILSDARSARAISRDFGVCEKTVYRVRHGLARKETSDACL